MVKQFFSSFKSGPDRKSEPDNPSRPTISHCRPRCTVGAQFPIGLRLTPWFIFNFNLSVLIKVFKPLLFILALFLTLSTQAQPVQKEPLRQVLKQIEAHFQVAFAYDDALMDEIVKQRRYSLFGEGHRWIDMRRWGRLNQLPIDRPGDDVWEKFPRPVSEVQ